MPAPAARSRGRPGPSSAKVPRCGNRPISTISSTVKSNGAWVSCGTSAMRRARSRRFHSVSGRLIEGDRARRRRQRPAQHLQQRGLAGAVRSEDADQVAAARPPSTHRPRRAAHAGDSGTRRGRLSAFQLADLQECRSSKLSGRARGSRSEARVRRCTTSIGELKSGLLMTAVWYSPRSPQGSTPRLRELVEHLGAQACARASSRRETRRVR